MWKVQRNDDQLEKTITWVVVLKGAGGKSFVEQTFQNLMDRSTKNRFKLYAKTRKLYQRIEAS